MHFSKANFFSLLNKYILMEVSFENLLRAPKMQKVFLFRGVKLKIIMLCNQ